MQCVFAPGYNDEDRFTLLRKPNPPDSASATSCEIAPSSDCHIFLPDIDFLYLSQQSWARDRASDQLALKAQIRFDKRIRIIEPRLDTQSVINTRELRIPQKKKKKLLPSAHECSVSVCVHSHVKRILTDQHKTRDTLKLSANGWLTTRLQ